MQISAIKEAYLNARERRHRDRKKSGGNAGTCNLESIYEKVKNWGVLHQRRIIFSV